MRWFRTAMVMAIFAPATPAMATDFGVRAAPGAKTGPRIVTPHQAIVHVRSSGTRLADAARVGRRFGTVTSMTRTPAHNRRVGGVPNSYHLSGRAIDVARRPGVTHAQIAAEYRRAGFSLVESLDEGDHSHFAFGPVGSGRTRAVATAARQEAPSGWKMVAAPRFREPLPEAAPVRLTCAHQPCTTAALSAPSAIATP